MAELKYVDWDGLVYYDGKIKDYIANKSEDYLKMGGQVPFEELPDPSFQTLNYIYKITNDFTTNDRFEDSGVSLPAGTLVQVVDFDEVYKFVVLNTPSTTSDVDDLRDYLLNNYYTKTDVDSLVANSQNTVKQKIEGLFKALGAIVGLETSADFATTEIDFFDKLYKCNYVMSMCTGFNIVTHINPNVSALVFIDDSGNEYTPAHNMNLAYPYMPVEMGKYHLLISKTVYQFSYNGLKNFLAAQLKLATDEELNQLDAKLQLVETSVTNITQELTNFVTVENVQNIVNTTIDTTLSESLDEIVNAKLDNGEIAINAISYGEFELIDEVR